MFEYDSDITKEMETEGVSKSFKVSKSASEFTIVLHTFEKGSKNPEIYAFDRDIIESNLNTCN